jgi:hypothetical protein
VLVGGCVSPFLRSGAQNLGVRAGHFLLRRVYEDRLLLNNNKDNRSFLRLPVEIQHGVCISCLSSGLQLQNRLKSTKINISFYLLLVINIFYTLASVQEVDGILYFSILSNLYNCVINDQQIFNSIIHLFHLTLIGVGKEEYGGKLRFCSLLLFGRHVPCL